MDLEERVFDDIVSDIAARDSVEVEDAIPEQKRTFCLEVFFAPNEQSLEKKSRKIKRRFDLLGISYEDCWRNDDKKTEYYWNMKFWIPSEKISFGTTMQLSNICTYIEKYMDANVRINKEFFSFFRFRDFKSFFAEDSMFNMICQLDKKSLEKNVRRFFNDDVLYKNYIACTQENFIQNYSRKKYDTYSYRTIHKISSFANGRIFKDDFWKICHSKYDTQKAYKLIVTYTGLEEYSHVRSHYSSHYKCDNPTPLNSLNAFKLQNRPILSSTVYELNLERRFIFLFFVGLTDGSDFEWLVVDVSSNKYSRVVSLIKTLFGKRTKMLCKKILKDMFHGNKREYREYNE